MPPLEDDPLTGEAGNLEGEGSNSGLENENLEGTGEGTGEPKLDEEGNPVVKEPEPEPEPDRFVKRINTKHRQLMEEKRRNEELQQRIDALEAQTKAQRPVIPAMPDPYEDGFDQRMKERDDAIIAAARFDADQKVIAAQKDQTIKAQAQQNQTELQEIADAYNRKATEFGITPDKLMVYGQTVAGYGLSEETLLHILADEVGPAITAHLAKNPIDLEAIANMTPTRAAVYIETKIKPKTASGVKAKGKEPPPPPDTLNGGGTALKERGPKGATYT